MKPANLIKSADYPMMLVTLLMAAFPLHTMRQLADMLGVNQRTFHRMRVGHHHFTYPQQLHTESFFEPQAIRMLRDKYHSPKPTTFWDAQITRRKSHVARS